VKRKVIQQVAEWGDGNSGNFGELVLRHPFGDFVPLFLQSVTSQPNSRLSGGNCGSLEGAYMYKDRGIKPSHG